MKTEADGRTAYENATLAVEKAKSLAQIPTLKSYKAVINSSDAPQDNCEFALVCEYDDIAGLEAYQIHPLHKEFGKFITPLRDTRACIDFEYEQ